MTDDNRGTSPQQGVCCQSAPTGSERWTVPIHKDGSHVFIDGQGDVELDHGGRMRAVVEAAQAYIVSLNEEPEKGHWDTPSGNAEPGAEWVVADPSWKAADGPTQKALDALRDAVAGVEGKPAGQQANPAGQPLEVIGRITEGGTIKWDRPPIRPGTTLYAVPGSTLAPGEVECVCKRAVCSYDPDFGCGSDQSGERHDL